MKRWRTKLLYLSAAAGLAAAIPAASQDAPESLLPPGFGEPDTPLPPRENPTPSPTPAPQPDRPTPGSPPAPSTPGTALPKLTIEDASEEDIAALEALNLVALGAGFRLRDLIEVEVVLARIAV